VVIEWSKIHHKNETKFVVASSEQEEHNNIDGDDSTPNSVPVNMVSVAIPVFYSIREDQLFDFAYKYKHPVPTMGSATGHAHGEAGAEPGHGAASTDRPQSVLESIATREVSRYLASTDFAELIGAERLAAQQELQTRIKAAVDALEPPLGINIEFVGLMEVHPPVEVAESYRNRISATEEVETKILKAQKYQASSINAAEGMASRIRLEAEAYRYATETEAEANAFRFKEQLGAYERSTEVYKQRMYLETLMKHSPTIRKYIIATDNAEQVITIDLKKTVRDWTYDVDLDQKE
jgi:regulator of protease activity HflC (stomatin/prohibitin superfamily)